MSPNNFFIRAGVALSRNYKTIFTVFLVLCIIPFFINSIYNHPIGDDYWQADLYRRLGWIECQKTFYYSYNGRYTAIFIETVLNPLSYGNYWLFKVIPPLLFLFLFYTLHSFIMTIGAGLVKRKQSLFAALLLLVLYLFRMNSVGNGFYNFVDSMTYTLATAFSLLVLTMLINFTRTASTARRIMLFSMSSVLIFAITSLNEVSLLIFFLLVCIFILVSVLRKDTVYKLWLAVLVVTVIGMYLSLSAPGNFNRMGGEAHNPQLVKVIFSCVLTTIQYLLLWIGRTPLLLVTVLFIPVAAVLSRNIPLLRNHFYIHPLLALLFFFGILSVSFFPHYWALGAPPPARYINNIYIFFLAGWFVWVQCMVSFAQAKLAWTPFPVPAYGRGILVFSICILLIMGEGNILESFKDISRGRIYDRDMKLRYATIHETKSKGLGYCEVPPLTQYPETIYPPFTEISVDPHHFKNSSYASYFDLDSIKVIDPPGRTPVRMPWDKGW
jgi:hypothetical protein